MADLAGGLRPVRRTRAGHGLGHHVRIDSPESGLNRLREMVAFS